MDKVNNDLKRDFDTLYHDILLNKLQYYGISDTKLKLFNNYVSNRKQFVQLGTTASNVRYMKTVVPQGSILGPLFSLFI